MNAPQRGTTQYRLHALIGAVAVFLLLDLSILALNYRISWEVDRDSVAINLAGRQRMLSQRITKSLLLLRTSSTPAERTSARNAFTESFALFNATLEAFDRGGEATGGDGRIVRLDPVRGNARATVAAAQARWKPLAADIAAAGDPLTVDYDDAVRAAVRDNDEILALMNRLTSQIEADSMNRTERLRKLQTLAFILAFANFLTILRMLHKRYCAMLRHQRELNSMLEEIGAGVLVLDDAQTIKRANIAAVRLLGRSVEELSGRRITDLLSQHEACWHGTRGDGSELYAELVPGRIDGACGPLNMLTLLDVTARHQQQAQLEKMAKLDALTGLPNRRALQEQLHRALAHAERSGEWLGLALIDLDHFKAVNDTYGHAAGDALLQEVARRVNLRLRASDTFARIGGDEFVALIGPVLDHSEIHAALDRLMAGLTEPFDLGPCSHSQQFSIGLAVYPQDGLTAEALLHCADSGMYDGRRNKRGIDLAAEPLGPPATG